MLRMVSSTTRRITLLFLTAQGVNSTKAKSLIWRRTREKSHSFLRFTYIHTLNVSLLYSLCWSNENDKSQFAVQLREPLHNKDEITAKEEDDVVSQTFLILNMTVLFFSTKKKASLARNVWLSRVDGFRLAHQFSGHAWRQTTTIIRISWNPLKPIPHVSFLIPFPVFTLLLLVMCTFCIKYWTTYCRQLQPSVCASTLSPACTTLKQIRRIKQGASSAYTWTQPKQNKQNKQIHKYHSLSFSSTCNTDRVRRSLAQARNGVSGLDILYNRGEWTPSLHPAILLKCVGITSQTSCWINSVRACLESYLLSL